MSDEDRCIVDAIPEYTKHTLKSFVAFIKNDFKSYVDEEIETKLDIFFDQESIFNRVRTESTIPIFNLFELIYTWAAKFPDLYPRMSKHGGQRLSYGYKNKKTGYTYIQFQIFENDIVVRIKQDSIEPSQLNEFQWTLTTAGYYEAPLNDEGNFNKIKEVLKDSIMRQLSSQ